MSLYRHWLCSRMAMYFLAAQTERLRGEKSEDHAEAGCGSGEHARMENMESPGAEAVYAARLCEYDQERNEAPYQSRRKTVPPADTS